MIVRIATEGQYELADDAGERLNALDNEAVAAVEAGDEARFHALFAQILATVRAEGTRLAEDDLRGSDVLVPPPDTSFDEARLDFTGEGLIPG
jgi:nuclear transport factor 2 (NTF2) superfamily protein